MSDTKKPASRIYRIHDKLTGDVSFCRARTTAQAINYVTRDRFTISPAKPDDLLGVARNEVLDATLDGVHPDQIKMPLPDKKA
jgi:hypothetical protein